MARLPLAFFTAAALCALGGMVWGVIMAASNDHTMMPAHAHLNLLGWATLALMGGFYALTGAGGRLGWINFWFSFVGVLIAVPGVAMIMAGKAAGEMPATVGSVLAIIGMLAFLLSILGRWRAAPAA
ncbi:MAG: hypothetical protein ACJ798_07600 [Phenylobacterium sp.]